MKPLLLDTAAVTSMDELHNLLNEALSFPAGYGNNLDALFDCLTDLGEETALTLCGTQTLSQTLGPRWNAFAATLSDAAAQNPYFTFHLQ